MTGVHRSWVVMAHRLSSSIFGQADAPCKRDGQIQYYDTEESAADECDRLNTIITSRNVWYSVEEL